MAKILMANQKQITEAVEVALKNAIQFLKKYKWRHLTGIQLGIELALMLPQSKGSAFTN